MSLSAPSLFDSFIIILYSADSILVVSRSVERKRLCLVMDIKENCAKEHTWARKRKNAQLLGKVRVLLSQSVEVYKLRRHLQWKGRDEWVACRAGQLIQRPVGVVEEKCLGKESIGPSDAVRSGSDTIRSIRHDEPADGRGTDKTEKKKSERAIWRHEKTSPVRVGPRSASNSS